MSQLRSQPSSLFRRSLRDWQANYKARQALQSDEPAALPAADGPPRQKRLVARRKRAQRQQASR